MNPAKVYENFIANRRQHPPPYGAYSECHHIIPRMTPFDGTDDESNLIRLIPEDHLFAHLLILKMCWSSENGEPPIYRPHAAIVSSDNYRKLVNTLCVMSRNKYVAGSKLARRAYGLSRRQFEIIALENMEKIRKWFLRHNRRPDKRSNNLDEKKLGKSLSHYVDQNSSAYRIGFKEELISLGFGRFFTDVRVNDQMDILREMVREGKRRPTSESNDPIEKSLGIFLGNTPQDFKDELVALGAVNWFGDAARHRERPISNKISRAIETIRTMAQSGDPRPSPKSKDPNEKKLGTSLTNCLLEYPWFKEELMAAAPKWFPELRTMGTMEELRQLARSGAPRPNMKSTDSHESYLGNMLSKLTYNKRHLHLGFKDELVALGAKDWFKELRTNDQMAELRELAKAGAPRPNTATNRKLAQALANYVFEGGESHKAGFKEELISLGARGWFFSSPA